MTHQALIPVCENSQIGDARRSAARFAVEAGLGEVEQGKVAIVATELASNLLKHAQHGEMLIQTVCSAQATMVEVLAIDSGPGISNLDLCLRDGYSTAGTPGNGLGAVRRLSAHFDVFSQQGRGTVILSRIGSQRPGTTDTEPFPLGSICIPVAGEQICGDSWRSTITTDDFRLVVSDGLGHGPLAAEASTAANAVFERETSNDPKSLMEKIHRALSGTRGAAVAVACFDSQKRQMKYAGVGNISGTLISSSDRHGLISHNGIVGGKLAKIQTFEYPYEEGGLLVMHSDGLKTRWSIDDYPGLRTRHPAVIASVLFRDFRRNSDDTTVVVVQLNHSRK